MRLPLDFRVLSLAAVSVVLASCAATLSNPTNIAQMSSGTEQGRGSSAGPSTTSRDQGGNDRINHPSNEDYPEGASAAPRVAGELSRHNAEPSGYRVGAFDTIEITVFRVPELSKVLTVSEVGTANFPLIGEVKVAGLTASDIERDLAIKLGAKYLQSPQVNVIVKEFNSKQVTMEGRFKKPGVYAMRGSMTLMQAVALGGGLDDLSDEQITISREEARKRQYTTFDLSQVRAGSIRDPELRAGDVLYAGTSAFREALSNIHKVTPLANVLRPF